VNFVLAYPVRVSIAAELDGRIVAGCVHNPISASCSPLRSAGGLRR